MKINTLNIALGGATALACLLAAVSCGKEQLENRDSESGAYIMTVAAGCPENVTKTAMTGNGTAENPYATVWNGGDIAGIFVGGDSNVQMKASGIDGGRAVFTGELTSKPETGEKVHFYYPWCDGGENPSAQEVKCLFPYAQNPSGLGTYDPKFDYMWGTSSVGEDGSVSLDLKYAIGFINLRVKELSGNVSVKIGDGTETLSADDAVKTVSIEAKPANASASVKLVGDFTMNLENGGCTVPDKAEGNNVGPKVLVNCPEGTTLGNLDIHACVHPFELTSPDDVLKFWIQTEKHYIIREVKVSDLDLPAFSVEAGQLKAFDVTVDAGNWTVSVNPYRGGVIKTPEQFLRFVQDVKDGSHLDGKLTIGGNQYAALAPDAKVENRGIEKWLDEDGVAKLGCDITVTDELKAAYGSLAGVPLWTKVFDGQGHTVTFAGKTLTRPMFANVFGGEVKNLTVAGEMGEGLESPAYQGACPLVGVLHSGTISNCTSKVNISVTKTYGNIALAGICRTMQGGTIENCTNDGEISFNAALTGPTNVYAGGIVAVVGKNYGDYASGSAKGSDPSEPFAAAVTISDCSNNKPVSLINTATNANNRMQYCCAGGIAGWVWGGVPDGGRFVTISNCNNSGSLKVDETAFTSRTTGIAGVGGILGWAAPTSSQGRLLGPVYGSPDTGNVEGFYLKIEDCSNGGDATVTASRKCGGSSEVGSAVYTHKVGCGGIAGIIFGQYNGSMAEITRCVNDGAVVGYEKTADADKLGQGSRYNVSGGIAGYCGSVKISGCTVGETKQAEIGAGGYNMAAAGIAGAVYSKFEISDCSVNAKVTRNNVSGISVFGSLVTNYIHSLGRSGADVLSGSVISGCRIKGDVLYTKTATAAPAYVRKNGDITETPDKQTYCVLGAEDLTKEGAGYITISGTTHLTE